MSTGDAVAAPVSILAYLFVILSFQADGVPLPGLLLCSVQPLHLSSSSFALCKLFTQASHAACQLCRLELLLQIMLASSIFSLKNVSHQICRRLQLLRCLFVTFIL